MFLAESETEPSCTTALNAQASDPYVYYVYSIMHMSDVLSLFFFIYLCNRYLILVKCSPRKTCTWTLVYIIQLSV